MDLVIPSLRALADRPAPSRRAAWTIAIVVIVVGSLPVTLRYLIFWPMDQWQVDVEVYRQAGESILTGRPIYSAMTEPPQLLPFTYPPFAAILAIPLALLPFAVVGWLWTALQVAATAAVVWYAGRRVLAHTRGWAPIVMAIGTVLALWLHPVSDGIRFGQVNAFIVVACVLDLCAPRPRWLAWVPRGVLIGLAVSIKLTPGVFIVHFLITRRWREAMTAIGTAVGVTLLSLAVLPGAFFAFWGGALQDPSRLGPNQGTSNQALRGVLLRYAGDGALGTVLWLVLAAAVVVGGFAVARRLHRDGDWVGEVAAVGLTAFLISPVSWIHHLHWIVVVILALLGAAPWADRRRIWIAAGLTAWMTCRMVWWGVSLVAAGQPWVVLGRFLQNSDTVVALVCLGLLARLARRDDPVGTGPVRTPDPQKAPSN